MEILRRERGDELLKPGELAGVRARLRQVADRHDLATVIVCAFDHRTRMLPFIFADKRMVPAGVRAIGSAMADSGFEKTRIVLQQWNKNVRPARMRLDGRIPDVLMISSMCMHLAPCLDLIRDAHRIDPAHRPLIIVGGPLCMYQPYEVFSADPASPYSADVAVTGEEFVLLSMLEIVLCLRAEGETMRSAFYRARDSGALEHVSGLVYARGDRNGVAEELADTGTQRLLGNLDELSDPILGYRLLEAPSRGTELRSTALAAGRVRALAPLASLVMTFGCKFACPYCPIPGYNQRQMRMKSGERIAEEMWHLHKEYGLKYFFGTDDNLFNDHERALGIAETLTHAQFEGVNLRRRVRWFSEVTVHDTLQMKDHLPLVRDAGCRALWLGVEDMTATLVKKGQSINKTTEAFARLAAVGICPMPMMMHHDSQPLYSADGNYGLLNQVRVLRKAGAVSLQVLMITPSVGSKLYEPTYASGDVFDRVGGRQVQPYMVDGNYVIASGHPQPWRKQLNLLLAYLYFYNPVWLVMSLIRRHTRLGLRPAALQLFGMAGLLHNIRRTLGWALRLRFCRITRQTTVPCSRIPMTRVGVYTQIHTSVPQVAPGQGAGCGTNTL